MDKIEKKKTKAMIERKDDVKAKENKEKASSVLQKFKKKIKGGLK